MPDEHAALGHLGGDRSRSGVPKRGSGRRRCVPGTSRVAPFASVKSVSAHIVLHTIGTCGFGERDELVVGVDRLGGLARADGDRRQRRDEAAGVEHALDDGSTLACTGIRS